MCVYYKSSQISILHLYEFPSSQHYIFLLFHHFNQIEQEEVGARLDKGDSAYL
jgi:hypothetical protein